MKKSYSNNQKTMKKEAQMRKEQEANARRKVNSSWDLMRRLVEAKPKYDKGILSMRLLMKRHNLHLESPTESELIEAFNSDMPEDEFATMLKEHRKKSPKAVAHLVQRIKKQEIAE